MTIPPDEHGDLLRRVMRAEADSVVPSPDGLEIIRHRIENRGLRGLLWWRIGASVAAAALVAGIVVVSVPEIRDNVGIIEVVNGTDQTPQGVLPSSDSTFQPPPAPSEPGIAITTQDPTKAPETPAPATSVAPSQPAVVPSPEPSANPCVTHEPTPTPDPGQNAAAKCPTEEANPTSGTGPKPKPTSTKTPNKPSPTPSADTPSPTPTGCGDTCETPTADPTPTETPSTTVEVSTPAS
ncbi:hypothetical protein [Herbidospora sp. RD11066]